MATCFQPPDRVSVSTRVPAASVTSTGDWILGLWYRELAVIIVAVSAAIVLGAVGSTAGALAQDTTLRVAMGSPGEAGIRVWDAIAEQFRTVSEIDDMAAASAVLSRVKDEYNLIVLFADFEVDLDGAFAYNAPIRNDIRGIGDAVGYDFSRLYGSNGRLEAFVQMGSLSKYPFGPNNFIRVGAGVSEATGIGILAAVAREGVPASRPALVMQDPGATGGPLGRVRRREAVGTMARALPRRPRASCERGQVRDRRLQPG